MFALGFRGRPGVFTPPPSIALTETHTTYTVNGKTVSAESDQSGGYEAWTAFDKLTSGGSGVNSWYPTNTPYPATAWLQYDHGVSKTLTSYELRSGGSGYNNVMPVAWTLYGSNTGAFSGEEDTLDTQTGLAAWGVSETRQFTPSLILSRRYHRFVFTAPNGAGNATSVNEIELFGY